MAIERDTKNQENKIEEDKMNTDITPATPICMRCNSAMDSSEKNSDSGRSNQIVLDAVPKFAPNKTFSEDDDIDWRIVEERERKAREELERKYKEEIERRKIQNILEKPSTSRSTHLQDILSQNQNDGPASSKNGVRSVADSCVSEKQDFINRRALRADSDTYELESFKSNVMLIFNQYDIDSYTKPREGTHKDVESLKNTFSKYNFRVIEREDKTKDEIFEILDEFCQNDFSEFGCVSVVVLTHGWDGGVLWAKDVTYNESEILQRFETHKNPSLVTKPKLFIFQVSVF
ncbi:Caspase-1 [Eumeta japonica]|uniref:Caspase-1 n=1 Tax=Eumeta variegata TaxID=151549 RepID=A0A4C1SU40_EUMVA|nr:Caspase-1 [Eumeta japonica]